MAGKPAGLREIQMSKRNTGRATPGRRELLAYSAFFGPAFMARQGLAGGSRLRPKHRCRAIPYAE